MDEVKAIDTHAKYVALVGDNPDERMTPGDSHEYLLPKLCEIGNRISYPVSLHCEQVVYEEGDLASRAIGACHSLRFGTGGEIRISKRSTTPNNTVRVLTHELTHALGARGPYEADNECTAEGTAFQVCRELGVDTSGFSFPYIALYYYPHNGYLIPDDIDKYTKRILDEIR